MRRLAPYLDAFFEAGSVLHGNSSSSFIASSDSGQVPKPLIFLDVEVMCDVRRWQAESIMIVGIEMAESCQ
jgi:hypothetical protein